MCSTIPRAMISSASSRWLQWLIGRSEPSGCSQANAMIWQICSGVIRAGAPDRGASASRSATLTSSSGTSRNPRHRRRQSLAVSKSIPRVVLIWVLVSPSAASNTSRARVASCCPVEYARTSRSNPIRSCSLNTTSGALHVGIRVVSSCYKMPPG